MGETDANSLPSNNNEKGIGFLGVQHAGFLCKDLEKSLEFYCGILGLNLCNRRPDETLSFRGAWLWIGNQMLHLMELPNPDPVTGRPPHGGEDRHICVEIENPERLKAVLQDAGVPYTQSMSLKPQIFIRDPDGNCLEFQPATAPERVG